ncbi:efflux RND transporter permease subunit [Halosimplex halophilum]|uniref:efflux RND transporter permease subunit n=1 Tax=Halosimplex halophilum TaxID=2559572 RepID=UPI00107F4E26|nr:MMPL family transporter [Halosimplex halophilum]
MVFEWFTDEVGDAIASYPGRISLAFLLVTAVFLGGLGNVETESGSNQFVEDLDSFEAFQDIQRDFGTPFGESSTTTQLLQREQNVLSRTSMLRMLRAQERLQDHDGLRVTGVSSPARTVAQQLDPAATTVEAQIDAVEAATATEIDRAVRRAAETPGFRSQVSEDFDTQSAAARSAQASVTHDRDVDAREERVERVVGSVAGDIDTVGSAPNTIGSSLALVLPAAFVLIVGFLVVAYRDLVDLILGVVAILLTLLWTFGFLGLAGIAFNPLLVAVPPLLIAVGIDFGIHAVNRYREERERDQPVGTAMEVTTDQLLVAFFIVMGTTVIGFLSNLPSALAPIRDFGFVAAVGICFTFLIFGIFLPAAKVKIDRLRARYPIPTMSERPLGSEGSLLGRALGGGVAIAQRAPALFMLVVLVAGTGAGVYATGVGTGFSEDDFLPPEYEEIPEWQRDLPGPFSPPEYSYVSKTNYVEDNFPQSSSVLLYVETRMSRDAALDQVYRMGDDPPPTILRDGRHAESQSVVTVVRSYADRDPAFADLVARNDPDADGIPEQNLGAVYDSLESAPGSGVGGVLADDRRSTLVTYSVDADATNGEVAADAEAIAAETSLDATPTGNAVIFEEASELILSTVVTSLLITLVGASVFLIVVYGVLEGRPSLGVANVVPIAVTVTFVVASMRYLGIDFNAINGVILSLTIGLGIDYSVHVVHRFADEFEDHDIETALDRAIRGTGGALTGSMLTTVSGMGMLVFALNPAIGVFGLLTALSVVYAYLASIVVLPSTLVLWDRVVNRSRAAKLLYGRGSNPTPESPVED